MPTEQPAPIIVFVDGGLVQDIRGIPPGVKVEVHDFDTDGDTPETDDRLSIQAHYFDGEPRPAYVTTYEGPERTEQHAEGPTDRA